MIETGRNQDLARTGPGHDPGEQVPDDRDEDDLAVDWAEIPLLAASLTSFPRAYDRCSAINPGLPALRTRAKRLVTEGIDELLRPAGYARAGASWHKGPVGATAPAEPAPAVGANGGPGLLSRLLGRGAGTARAALLLGGNDGAVRLSLQWDRYGTGLFVNVQVRHAGRHDPAAGVVAGGSKGYRGQSFVRDLPRNYVVDLYPYVRLVEDPRYLEFLLALVEDRMLPFMEAYADRSVPVARLPLVDEVVGATRLRLPESERRRLFEFAPTQQQYEWFAAQADSFAFALRDGRAFRGGIRDVAPGRLLVSWEPATLPGAPGAGDDPVPPDEWIPFGLVDPGSLSYRARDSGHVVVVDLTVDPSVRTGGRRWQR